MIDFLRSEGISEEILERVEAFRRSHPVDPALQSRVPAPEYKYYGKEIWEQALTALLAGENILLVGPKATGKNVLAENLAAVFGRPSWDISFYLNTDAGSLIGTDTFKNNEVTFRPGPVYSCAQGGGFGILDEINMAKNESLAVLHATLDFRRIIEVPGYDRISLHPETRFIATMNYGYAGTREINEALASRFMVLDMPLITEESLYRLLRSRFAKLNDKYARLLSELFGDIRKKCSSGEISSKALDLRGLVATVNLVENGLGLDDALKLGIINKSFDEFEKQLISDVIKSRIPSGAVKSDLFE